MAHDVPTAAQLRADYPVWRPFQTRWNDNDIYGHVNNTVHYLAMDTVINAWMIEHCGLDIEHGDSIGLCVESQCRYVESAAYPETLDIGLRAARVGSSSMTWELAMVRADDTPIALGRFVHVFVDAQTRRPTPIPDRARDAMRGILAPGAAG